MIAHSLEHGRQFHNVSMLATQLSVLMHSHFVHRQTAYIFGCSKNKLKFGNIILKALENQLRTMALLCLVFYLSLVVACCQAPNSRCKLPSQDCFTGLRDSFPSARAGVLSLCTDMFCTRSAHLLNNYSLKEQLSPSFQ